MSHFPLRYTLNDIRDFFTETTILRGLDIFKDGKVDRWKFIGTSIKAETRGSTNRRYSQEIDVVMHNGQMTDILGECSCPVGYECKHVVAVLLEVMKHLERSPLVNLATMQIPDKVGLAFHEQRWLKEIERELSLEAEKSAGSSSKKEKSESQKKLASLIFTLKKSQRGDQLSLAPAFGKWNTKGEFKATKIPYGPFDFQNKNIQMQAADYELLGFYKMCIADRYYVDSYPPTGQLGAMLMDKIARAGKLYWQYTEEKQVQLKPLAWQQHQTAHLAWHQDQDRWCLGWQLANEQRVTVLPTEPAWYVTDEHFGVVNSEQAEGVLSMAALTRLIASAPRIPVREQGNLQEISRYLLALPVRDVIPVPGKVKSIRRDDVVMRPYLLLASHEAYDRNYEVEDFAQLKFSYEGNLLEQDSRQEQIHRNSEQGVEIIVRDRSAEDAALAQLVALRFVQHAKQKFRSNFLHTLADQDAWLAFSREVVPQLIAQHWEIHYHDSYRYHLEEIEEWYAEVAEENQTSPWFDLELGIIVKQTKVSLLPVLVALIRQTPHDFNPNALNARRDDEQLLVQLPDGMRVALPYARVNPILLILGELYLHEKQGDRMRLPMLDAARIAELAAATNLRWIGGERQQEFGKKLNTFGGVTAIKSPAGLKAKLRDYQKEGVAWMQFLREYQLAGILADDMGLGKTLQTLTHILIEKNQGRLTQPALVIAPTSLMDNWADEARRFAPKLKVLVLYGPEREQLFESISQFDLVLTTYALLPRDENKLRQHAFHLLILDEAQYIKNPQSKAAQTAGLINANHRLCLTGTPVQNHLGELWSQFHFLIPGLLGDAKSFTKDFRTPIEKSSDGQRQALLTRRIRPFLLRRTKDKVAKELPPKTEIIRHVELEGAQRDLYETVRLAMDKKVRDEISKKGIARSQIVILDALLKLRQVCCDPRLVKLTALTGSKNAKPKANQKNTAIPSAKLSELLTMVDELLEEGRRILIFSQFTSMLALIEIELQQKQIPYALLTGDTVERGAEVKRFQEGEVPLFLISLKAGGVGLNLTAADTVIHYDPWWNPAAESQATDRAWRIGQDKPVFVYRLIAKGSLEEKILAMQGKKADLARAMLDHGDVASIAFTTDDLQGIFAPLDGV